MHVRGVNGCHAGFERALESIRNSFFVNRLSQKYCIVSILLLNYLLSSSYPSLVPGGGVPPCTHVEVISNKIVASDKLLFNH